MEMIYRMQRGYDKNKAWEKGLIGRTGDFMDGDISLDDWWEATYLKTGLVAAQGTKYILEASIPYVGVAVLATDVFGNSYNDISVNHPEWSTEETVLMSGLYSAAEVTINQLTRRLGLGAEAGIDKLIGINSSKQVIRDAGRRFMEKNLAQKVTRYF